MMDVTCTPISVDRYNRDDFETLDDLKIITAFDSTNTKQVMDCFVRLVNLLEHIVVLQEDSLNRHGLPYRPVCLTLGQDSGNPTNINVIYTQLFGERFSGPETYDALRESAVQDWLTRFPRFKEHQVRLVIEEKYLDRILETNERKEVKIRQAQKLRNAFLARFGIIPKDFVASCHKLTDLLDKCSLRTGYFRNDNYLTMKFVKQDALDAKVIKLRQRFNGGDALAYYGLRDLAEEAGQDFGKAVTLDPSLFCLAAPAEYKRDPKLQVTFPRWAFLHDYPDFVRAFHDGFKDTYRGPYPRLPKMPLDSPRPFFTDPLSDLIRGQFEILEGFRDPNGHEDRYDQRMQVINSARGIVKGVIPPRYDRTHQGSRKMCRRRHQILSLLL